MVLGPQRRGPRLQRQHLFEEPQAAARARGRGRFLRRGGGGGETPPPALSEHFTVDGTLLEAWASLKSYRPRDDDDEQRDGSGGRNPWLDFRGQRRRRDTHSSRTDPAAQLYTKGSGQAAKLSYIGHVLTENRNGLVVGVALTEANGTAEREAALALLDRCVSGRATLGADRGYDTRDFVEECRRRAVTPHVARNDKGRRSAIDGRTTRHPGYVVSQRLRKRVEEVFGWGKTVGGLRKLRYIGRARNALSFTLANAAYTLLRMAKLDAAPAQATRVRRPSPDADGPMHES